MNNGELYDATMYLTAPCPWPSNRVNNDEEWMVYRSQANLDASAYYSKDWAFPGYHSRVR